MIPAWRVALPLSSILLLIYGYTLFPTVGGGDSGELIAVAATLGIAHPPGYPLYTMLGKVFTFLPWGEVAWRVNFFSAVCHAAAAFFLCLAVARWAKSLAAGALAAGLFGLSPLGWRYAVTAEVFALNTLLASLLLYLRVRHEEDPRPKWFCLAAFVAGLGISHHHLLIFFSGPILWSMRPTKSRDLYRGAGALLLGLTPYLYLPWAASRWPAIAWGDLTTIKGFLTHFFRREYGTFQLSPIASSGPLALPDRVVDYALDLFRQTLFIGPGLAAAAIFLRGKDRILKDTLIAVGIYVVVFHLLSNLDLHSQLDRGVQSRFWIQPNLWFCAWAGLGLAQLFLWLPPNLRLLKFLVPLVLIWTQGLLNFHAENRRHQTAFRDYAVTVMAPLPTDALLIVRGDLAWNTARYLQAVEGYRPDLRLVHWNLLRAPWLKEQVARRQNGIVIPGTVLDPLQKGGYSFQTFLEANDKGRPLFVCDENPRATDNPRFELGYTRWPWGFTEVLLADDQRMNVDVWLAENEKILRAFDPRWLTNFAGSEWEQVLSLFFLKSHLAVTERVMLEAETSRRPKYYRETARLIEEFLEKYGPLYPDLRPQMQKNLGLTWWKLASKDRAAKQNAIAAWKEFLREAPPGYPEADKVALFLENLPHWQPKGAKAKPTPIDATK